ncbi:CYTH domain-containing protein [Winogradskyella sp. DF17]|uniref:CYTH domain-containing protein n=1 Tax=Winogradskyella pelagia TaxID=2819984 RepID=A0ABS3SY02_9FLAO|nr:CYTH domain-containing protein [Winogradskyella sp. DF17]MBO3115349.1 CYTH domain-containing protein [Winogradskyella sp. DF17]
MAIEIERKFLVLNTSFKYEVSHQYRIVQGFLNSHKERTVRVRILEKKGVLTIKGKSFKDGLVRFEWEKEIPLLEAESLLELCEPGIVEKIRYQITLGEYIFEVDEFLGENEGLIIAEIELNTENDIFEKPSWLGKEVTGNVKYYNSQLATKPYKHW